MREQLANLSPFLNNIELGHLKKYARNGDRLSDWTVSTRPIALPTTLNADRSGQAGSIATDINQKIAMVLFK